MYRRFFLFLLLIVRKQRPTGEQVLPTFRDDFGSGVKRTVIIQTFFCELHSGLIEILRHVGAHVMSRVKLNRREKL